MRLAIIRQRYTPYGGAERFIEGALEALLERNVAITLYTREWPQTKLQLIEPHIVDPYYLGSFWRDWGFARAVTRAIGTAKVNLVQSHERVLCCDIYRAGDGVHAVWLEERGRGASVWKRLAQSFNPRHRYTLDMERRLFASPWLRAVICNSKMVRDEIKARFGLPDERLPVIYNAVDFDVFNPSVRELSEATRRRYRIPAEAVTFVLVGSGYERKGVATAIQALAELPAPTHLIVVGRDKRIGRYKRMARALGVRERVTFAGPQTDVLPFLGAADAFVLPTLYDPLPNAALEAMACGLPIITSTKSGAAELVQENGGGLICAAGDTAALAKHMRSLLDPELRATMGAQARLAVAPLTPSAMTLQLVLLYKGLLEASVAHRMAARAAAEAAAASAEANPLHGEDGLEPETLLPGTDSAASSPAITGVAPAESTPAATPPPPGGTGNVQT